MADRAELVEKGARAICREKCAFMGEPPCFVVLDDSSFSFPPETCCEPGCVAEASALIDIVLEEAARAAEGPPYRTSGTTGEVSLRGGDGGNWSVPMPISGFKGSDYGTGRYDAAAAIRAMRGKD